MQKPISNVAIGTWPTPERILENFNLESFFLDQLVRTKVFDRQMDLDLRFQLAIDSIKRAERAGYFVDRVPDECKSEPIPPWCLVAGVIIDDGRILLIDNLIANGVLEAQTHQFWQKFVYEKQFIHSLPTLFRHFKIKGWTAEKSLSILDQSFEAVSGVAYPIPDSDLDKFCRKHPASPICKIAGIGFSTEFGRNLARELIIVGLLEQENVIRPEQARAIYDVYLKKVNPVSTASDISIYAGIIIIDGLALDKKTQVNIKNTLATERITYIDPDSPLARICFGASPPPFCHFMRAFPVAAILTDQLVQNKIWSEKIAQEIWTDLYRASGQSLSLE